MSGYALCLSTLCRKFALIMLVTLSVHYIRSYIMSVRHVCLHLSCTFVVFCVHFWTSCLFVHYILTCLFPGQPIDENDERFQTFPSKDEFTIKDLVIQPLYDPEKDKKRYAWFEKYSGYYQVKFSEIYRNIVNINTSS